MKKESQPAHPPLSPPDEMALVRSIAEALNEATDISSAMAAILPRLGQVLGLTTAWAFRFDERRATFVEVGASGLPPALEHDNAAALKSSWCECQERLVTGKLDTAINIVHCSRLRSADGEKNDLEFHASIPLKMDGRPLGILNVAAAGAQVFTVPALDLLRAIGYHVAVTIDRASLISDLRRHNQQLHAMQTMTRDMTGIMQKEALFTRAAHLLSQQLHHDAVAILENQTHVIVKALSSATEVAQEYSYEGHAKLLAPEDRLLLDDARSVLSVAIPHSPYTIRVESRYWHAFDALDEDILSAFAWHLTALMEQSQLYSQAIASARWSERRQLAADLHDSVSQQLFSAQLLLRSMSTDDHVPTPPIKARRLAGIIQQSQHEMRNLIHALRDEAVPLGIEISHRLLRLKEILGRQLTYDLDSAAQTIFAPATTDGVIRILDEALQNALKHAPDASLNVTYHESSASAILTIRDEGPGFDVTHHHLGVGLASMQERARSLGLILHIDSSRHQGTTIGIEVPKGSGSDAIDG